MSESQMTVKASRAHILAMAASIVVAPAVVRAQGLEKIRIGAVPTDDMTPIFYAIKSGMYQKAGLDVEDITTNSGSASTAAVVGGTYELAKASPIASLLAYLRGLPLTIVANGAVWDAKSKWNSVVVAADSPIKSGADCNDKIGSAPALNDTAQFGVLEWVDKHGGDSKTMKWVEIPGSASPAALRAHRVDVTSLNEPQLTEAISEGNIRALGPAHAAIADHWVAAVYLTRPDWAKSHVDTVRRWVRVTYEAAAYANTHESDTVALMADVTKIPIGIVQKMARIYGATSSDPSLLQPVIDLAVKYKALPRAFAPKEIYFSA
jgi:NitT/TauT family transport system substrate-binding protein